MSRFKKRSGDVEVMDDLACSGEVVSQTIRELEIINHLLGGNAVTLDGLAKLLRDDASNDSVRIVDLGCGGGDMLKQLEDWGKKHSRPLNLLGVDANPFIVELARNNLTHHPAIVFEVANIFSPEFRDRKFDVFTATLFMHHFSDSELVDILRWLRQRARIGIVINDIHRHALAFYSIRLLTRLFSKSSMVKYDAPLSVLRAFSRNELKDLLRRAGIKNYTLSWKWAFRWQMVIYC